MNSTVAFDNAVASDREKQAAEQADFRLIPNAVEERVTDTFRQVLLSRILCHQEGLLRTNHHIETLIQKGLSGSNARFDQKARDRTERIAFLETGRSKIQNELKFMHNLDSLLMLRQSAQAQTKKTPDEEEGLEEALKHAVGEEITLPGKRAKYKGEKAAEGADGIGSASGTGAPASQGNAFARACPADDYSILEGEGSGSLILPVKGILSAGTWAYASGGMHLGMDLAAPMYSELIAPADGVIVYANAPVGDGGGYLGNWCGWPYGGGNTIAMIASCESGLYGITFCHLSSRILVRSGQQVRQGQVIAKTGNTGNSTGPHTHVELFVLRTSFEEAASYFSKTADFAFGCGWSAPGTCSAYGCRVRPEKHFQFGQK